VPYSIDSDLRCLAELLDPVSRARLAPFAQPGAKCLEVGTASIARWLAAQVGERGHVTALEVNPHSIPDGPYDLIHARLMLSHLPKRREILGRLVDRLAPNGVLVIGDWRRTNPDPIVLAPSFEAGELYRKYQWTVNEQVWGTDDDWATSTYEAMRGEGLADVHTTVSAEYWRGGGTGLQLVQILCRELEEPLLAAGLTEDELEELGRLLDEPSFVVHGLPLYYTSGRKMLGRHLVQEAEHAPQLAVAIGHGDVESDDERFAAWLAQRPREPGLVVVAVDRAGQRKREARELRLDRPDCRVDGVPALGDGERVNIRPAIRPQFRQGAPAGRRVPLVPRVDVALGDVLEIRHDPTIAVTRNGVDYLRGNA
jgi:SAM-dependent methyltransferase